MFQKVIIWLFERYCWDDWATSQQENADKEIMGKYNLKTQDELLEYYSDKTNSGFREVYDAGFVDGYDKATGERY